MTVEAVLDAVVKLLKTEGTEAVTTNRVAEVAGVSIGSIYQYFPDKRAIFAALHQRHVQEIDRMVESTLIEHARSRMGMMIRAMIDAMVQAHAGDPALYEVMSMEVPHRADGTAEFAVRLHGAFRLALAARANELKRGRDLDKAAFVVAHMVESLGHGVVLRRPPGMSMEAAKQEAVRAVLAYLHS
jgi:AcrR family transcriptional regulator